MLTQGTLTLNYRPEPPLHSYLGPPGEAASWSGRDWTPFLNMADTNMGVGTGEKKHHTDSLHESLSKPNGMASEAEAKTTTSGKCPVPATREYCEELQAWMWQYYTGYVSWQGWLAATALPCPYYLQSGSGGATATPFINSQNWYGQVGHTLLPYQAAASPQSSRPGEAALPPPQQQVPQENGNAPRAGECCCYHQAWKSPTFFGEIRESKRGDLC